MSPWPEIFTGQLYMDTQALHSTLCTWPGRFACDSCVGNTLRRGSFCSKTRCFSWSLYDIHWQDNIRACTAKHKTLWVSDADFLVPFLARLQVIDFPEAKGPLELSYDKEWLAVLKNTHHLLSLDRRAKPLPGVTLSRHPTTPQPIPNFNTAYHWSATRLNWQCMS